MKQKYPVAPILPKLTLTDSITLDNESMIERVHLKEQNLSYQDFNGVIFRENHFEKVTMTNNHLTHFECSNVLFDHCDFSNTEWIGGSFHQVHFRHCKLTGTNFAESYLRDCLFENCLADYSSFSSSNEKIVHFKNSSLNSAEFFEMEWQHILLTNCSLTDSNWFKTKLNNLDFSESTFQKIAVSQELLSGLKVNPEQALIIAAGMGMIIE